MTRAARPLPPPGAAATGPPRAARPLARIVRALDSFCDRVYGSRWNPLHQSGNLAVLFFLVTLGTGLYLFLFYKIADAHGSVERIREQTFLGVHLGGWVRSLHRYSADLAMVAIVVHLLRKVARGHTWGPRFLAWTSGVALLGIVLMCGWTGLVLVWDVQALEVAAQGARLLDLLPVFSLPISRSFSGETDVPSSFFFMNLFLHVALPLGLAAGLWLHVSRVARPALLPPRPIRLAVLALLGLFAALWPVILPPPADLLALPGEVPLDLFYAFWLPVARRVSPLVHLALWLGLFAVLAAAPRYWRPRRAINVSWVDESSCTECETCYQDCPYEAISMVPRTDFSVQKSARVAHVDPARCVGCGICAGSCAPMGVGPFGRTGRDQLEAARAWLARQRPSGREVALLACRNALGASEDGLGVQGVVPYPVSCAGSVHTAVVELLIRSGVGGVFLLSCPPRDCSFREGPKWAEARLFHGREAELKPRVDRRRVAFASYSTGEATQANAALVAFRDALAALDVQPEAAVEIDAECEPAELVEEATGA